MLPPKVWQSDIFCDKQESLLSACSNGPEKIIDCIMFTIFDCIMFTIYIN